MTLPLVLAGGRLRSGAAGGATVIVTVPGWLGMHFLGVSNRIAGCSRRDASWAWLLGLLESILVSEVVIR